MAYDTADREAHVILARRRLDAAVKRGAWPETVADLTARLLTAERLLRNALR